MSLEVKIEIRSIVRKHSIQLANKNTHSYVVFVQGLISNQIEHFVREIVFHVPSGSSDSKIVKTKPPYLVSGSARASFRLLIDVFLHTSDELKVEYSYYVCLPDKPLERALNVKTLKFLNAPQDFRKRLIRGGAETVEHQINSPVAATDIKNEPVEKTENQNELFGNERNADFENVENEDLDIQIDISDQLSDTCVQSNDISEQKSCMVIQRIYSFDELLKENGILKKENEALFDKFSKQEGVIATYVEKLPALQDVFSAISTELNHVKQVADANETELSSLKSAVEVLKTNILHKADIRHENTVSRPKKRQRKEAALSVVSESFESVPSVSVELESNSDISSRTLRQKDKGRAVMDKCEISRASLEFPTLNFNSSITQDACENKPTENASSLSRKNTFSVSSLPTENVSNLRELPMSMENIPPLDKELHTLKQNPFQKEPVENLTEGSFQHRAEPNRSTFSLTTQLCETLVSSSERPNTELQIICENISDSATNIHYPPQQKETLVSSPVRENNELQIVWENISDSVTWKCFKTESRHSSLEAKDSANPCIATDAKKNQSLSVPITKSGQFKKKG